MDDFDLAGLEAACDLPTPEEQAAKEAEALDKVRDFIVSHGGTWEDGWTCRMRFRVTSRRNGKMGRTTDNYYYTPCGRCFRNYKQIAEFLKLNADATVRGKPGPKAAKRPAPAAAAGPSNDSWRSTATDAGAAVVTAAAAVQKPVAAAAVATAGPSSSSPSNSSASCGGSSGATDDTARSASPAPASEQQPPAKKARTKAAIAAQRVGTAALLPRLLPLAPTAGAAPARLGRLY